MLQESASARRRGARTADGSVAFLHHLSLRLDVDIAMLGRLDRDVAQEHADPFHSRPRFISRMRKATKAGL
jgi:hypothetical protein